MKKILITLTLFTHILLSAEGDFLIMDNNVCQVMAEMYDHAYIADLVPLSHEQLMKTLTKDSPAYKYGYAKVGKIDSSKTMAFSFKLKYDLKNKLEIKSEVIFSININKKWYTHSNGFNSLNLFIFFNGSLEDPHSFVNLNEDLLFRTCGKLEKIKMREKSNAYSLNKKTLQLRINRRELKYFMKSDISLIGNYHGKSSLIKGLSKGAQVYLEEQWDLLEKNNFDFEKNSKDFHYVEYWLKSVPIEGLIELYHKQYTTDPNVLRSKGLDVSYLGEQFLIAKDYGLLPITSKKGIVNQKTMVKELPFEALIKLYFYDYSVFNTRLRNRLGTDNYNFVEKKFKDAINNGKDLVQYWRDLTGKK